MKSARRTPHRTNRSRFGWLGLGLVTLLVAGVVTYWLARPVTTPVTSHARGSPAKLMSHTPAPGPIPSPPKTPRTDRERILEAAFALRGTPYRWGAKGPNAFDCSGFTRAAYAKGGVKLPDGSFNQAKGEKPLKAQTQLVAGDLLLYRWPGHDQVGHVTLYAGNGWVIGTGTPGQPSGVTVYPLASDLRSDGRVITFRHIRLADER